MSTTPAEHGSQRETARRRQPLDSRLVLASTPASVEEVEALRSASPVPIELVELNSDGTPHTSRDEKALEEVEALWAHGRVGPRFIRAAIEQLPRLHWIHSDFVGIDALPLETLSERGIVVTNGADNFARPMAEWVILGLLSFAKHLPGFIRRSDKGVWDTSEELEELSDKVLLLLGLGAVNLLVAEMALPFRLDVRGLSRRPRESCPTGVGRLLTATTWREELPEADYVVLGLPLTRATRNIIDHAALDAMKPGSVLINPARGALIDESALVRALDSGHLGGVLLDAFETEPLPSDHPLWRRPNATIIPHHTWSSTKTADRLRRRFSDELLPYLAGEALRHPVDLDAGY